MEDARRFGFLGSPTILIDGSDPFGPAGAEPTLACRLYWTTDGVDGVPTVEDLCRVLMNHS